eukprot:CAMPEP_0172737552 /NCGR_PEP_ID=MMETSP1074-20121228/117932_1 /TAXON_ID=2916 /ORGANISM="Ceratium fusus, Strain PA161109" /LENGTH=83 /DNA_ID=CAMNT_0013566965 /DNA_START=170 /DNA_END=418 /DNA_ORIENTATION=-
MASLAVEFGAGVRPPPPQVFAKHGKGRLSFIKPQDSAEHDYILKENSNQTVKDLEAAMKSELRSSETMLGDSPEDIFENYARY